MSLNIELYVTVPNFVYRFEPEDEGLIDAVAAQNLNDDRDPPRSRNILKLGISEHSSFASFKFFELINVPGVQYLSGLVTYLPSSVNHHILKNLIEIDYEWKTCPRILNEVLR